MREERRDTWSVKPTHYRVENETNNNDGQIESIMRKNLHSLVPLLVKETTSSISKQSKKNLKKKESIPKNSGDVQNGTLAIA